MCSLKIGNKNNEKRNRNLLNETENVMGVNAEQAKRRASKL